MRPALLLLAATAVLLLAAYKISPASGAELYDLHGLDDVKAAVNHDTSAPRIVLLLSPT